MRQESGTYTSTQHQQFSVPVYTGNRFLNFPVPVITGNHNHFFLLPVPVRETLRFKKKTYPQPTPCCHTPSTTSQGKPSFAIANLLKIYSPRVGYSYLGHIYPDQSSYIFSLGAMLKEIQLVKNMSNIPGNKVEVAHKIKGEKFLAKGFFVIMDVHFQNMAIRNYNFQRQTAIKPQKLIVQLGYLSYQLSLKNSLNRRYQATHIISLGEVQLYQAIISLLTLLRYI